MLRWILIFLIVALVTGVLGFTGLAGAATEIARLLCAIFFVVVVGALLFDAFRGTPPA